MGGGKMRQGHVWLYGQANRRDSATARRAEQAPERASRPAADRKDRTQRLSLQPKSAGRQGR